MSDEQKKPEEKLAEELGLKFSELNSEAQAFLKGASEAQAKQLKETLEKLPEQSKKDLLNAAMGSYILEVGEKKLVSPEQVEALVAVLEANQFKVADSPKLSEAAKENESEKPVSAEDFQKDVLAGLQRIAKATLKGDAGKKLSEEQKTALNSLFEKAPLEALVREGKVATSVEQVLENIQHKTLGTDIANAKEAAGKLEGDAKTAAEALLTKREAVLDVARQYIAGKEDVPLKDDKGQISGGVKELMNKVWKLEDEKLEAVHKAVDEVKKKDKPQVFGEQLKAQGIDAEKTTKDPAQREPENGNKKKWIIGSIVVAAVALAAWAVKKAMGGKEDTPQLATAGAGHSR